jgi:hypothetical protein
MVANFNVEFGKDTEFVDLVNKFDTPMFEQLMNKGLVMAWGLSTPVMHQPGSPTHAIWWTSPSMAEMDQVIAAFEANEKKMLEEDPGIFQTMAEIVDLSKHYDVCFRDLVSGFGAPPPAGAKPYTWIFTTKVHYGHGEEYVTLWNKYTKPLLDKMVAEGRVGAYGLSIQEVKMTDEFSHFTWVSVPSFTDYEKVRAAYMADRKSRPADEQKKLTAEIARITDPDASRTYVLREEILHVAAPK